MAETLNNRGKKEKVIAGGVSLLYVFRALKSGHQGDILKMFMTLAFPLLGIFFGDYFGGAES